MLAQDLKDQGFNAEAFHAGMKVEVKQKIQDDFLVSKIPIVGKRGERGDNKG
jgi:superfamily II DNA helicase RecQ